VGFFPGIPYQGSSLDQLETLSGPQTPRRLSSPLTQNPGSAPGIYSVMLYKATLKILFVWHCRPTLSISRWVGRQGFYYFLFFFTFMIWKLYIFGNVFLQEHRGRYDIKESNLMQHKEQQKSNSIFIKKNIFCLSGCFPLPAFSTLFSFQQTIFYSMSFKRLLSIQCTSSAFIIEIWNK
jgi:hypothetical protein